MVDPVSAAINGVASGAVSKVIEAIESSEDAEETWRRSGVEIAIKIRTVYREVEQSRGRENEFDRELRRYGKMARELAVRGELKNFDEEFIEKLNSLADVCNGVQSAPNLASKSRARQFEAAGGDNAIEAILEGY